MALPHRIFAVVFKVTLWSAMILPANTVEVPRVAELPTCQIRLLFTPPLITFTAEALAVVRVLPIWKTNSALGLP